MKLALARIVLCFGSILFSSVIAQATCTASPPYLTCDLVSSDSEFVQGVGPNTNLVLTNTTGAPLIIDYVKAETGETLYWSEFCVFLNDFYTGQHAAGVGEIGCTFKNPGENYAAIDFPKGLHVPDGSTIWIGSHTVPNSINHTYKVMAHYQPKPSYWRFPAVDQIITCNGAQQATTWAPWRNTTGHAIHMNGARSFAVTNGSPTPNQVTLACLYVMNTDLTVKWQYCGDLNKRGWWNLPSTQLIQPNEYMAAGAINTCTSGQTWDWALYVQQW